MTDQNLVRQTLRALVARVAGARRAATAPPGDAPLGEGGWWLDSLELLEVVVGCETEFGIVFEPSRDLTDGALQSLDSLAALVRRKISGPTPAIGGV
jgi:acyl carrier protein